MPPLLTHLVQGVEVSGTLLDLLVQKGLLTLEDRSAVDKVQSNTEEDKVRRMLDILRKKPSGSFRKFCSGLQEVGYKDLADRLRSGGKGKRVPSIQCCE